MNKTTCDENIYVTQPSLPPLEEYNALLEEIWRSKQLTNGGQFHQRFEEALAEYLGVKYCSLMCNGTMALQIGLQAFDISGEVITTPYSFPATTHAIHWNKCTPVFCDIKDDFTLDPQKVEAAITPRTTAIMPVHVYGVPCDLDAFDMISKKYGIKVLYDGAHAFGVKVRERSIFSFGDLSMVSFHATKIFHTAEGGALITNDLELKKKIDLLRNFGFAGETTIIAPGCNGKMNELQAALGLLQLKYADAYSMLQKEKYKYYVELLRDVEGIELLKVPAEVTWNYSYFPIVVNESYPLSRDELYGVFRDNGIWPRRYFYPLISDFVFYRNLPSDAQEDFPIARQKTDKILCLPLYAELQLTEIDFICEIITKNAL